MNLMDKLYSHWTTKKPILFGEDARKFEERMKQVRKETPGQREKRLKRYKAVMNVFKE